MHVYLTIYYLKVHLSHLPYEFPLYFIKSLISDEEISSPKGKLISMLHIRIDIYQDIPQHFLSYIFLNISFKIYNYIYPQTDFVISHVKL